MPSYNDGDNQLLADEMDGLMPSLLPSDEPNTTRTNSNNNEGPEDEQLLAQPAWMTKLGNTGQQRTESRRLLDDEGGGGRNVPPQKAFGRKKNARPWNTTNDDGDLLDEEQVDIVGVRTSSTSSSNRSSPKNNTKKSEDGGEDDLSYEEELNSHLLQPSHTKARSARSIPRNISNTSNNSDILADLEDDVAPSRWRQNISSPEERTAANVRAIALASERAANKSLRRDELLEAEEERVRMMEDNSSACPTPTNEDMTRHEQVRNDALMMLRLAEGDGRGGGGLHQTKMGGYSTQTKQRDALPPSSSKRNALSSLRMETRVPSFTKVNSFNRTSSYTPNTGLGGARTRTALYGPSSGRFCIDDDVDEEDVEQFLDDRDIDNGGVGSDIRKRLYEQHHSNRKNKNTNDENNHPNVPPRRITTGKRHPLQSPEMKDILLIEESPTQNPITRPSNKNGWGSRYSVDRHMRALHGGMSSQQVLHQMDQQSNPEVNDRNNAMGMVRTSPYEEGGGMYSGRRITVGGHVQASHRVGGCEYDNTERVWGARSQRMWNTMVASMQSTYEDISVRTTKAYQHVKTNRQSRNGEEEDEHDIYTTRGDHRSINHSGSNPAERESSSRKSPMSVFTGISLADVLARLSPRSRDRVIRTTIEEDARGNSAGGSLSSCASSITASVRKFNDRRRLGGYDEEQRDLNFTARDDFEIERKAKRRHCIVTVAMGSLLVFFFFCVLVGTGILTHRRSITIDSDSGHAIASFYVVGDTPRTDEEKVKLQRDIAELDPKEGSFLFHLGNVRAKGDTDCNSDSFVSVAEILKESPVPVLVLPGNKDWSDCPNPKVAFESWMDHLNRFEEQFEEDRVVLPPTSPTDTEDEEDTDQQPSLPVVERHLARDENFAILLEDILIIGIHLIDHPDGPLPREWSLRHQDDVQWVEEQLSRHRKETRIDDTDQQDDDNNNDDNTERNSRVPMSEPAYRAVVILGHAPATDSAKVATFFGPIKHDLAMQDVPVLYLHAHVGSSDGDGETMVEYMPFPNEVPRMRAAEIPVGGGDMGILKVVVGPTTQPFQFE